MPSTVSPLYYMPCLVFYSIKDTWTLGEGWVATGNWRAGLVPTHRRGWSLINLQSFRALCRGPFLAQSKSSSNLWDYFLSLYFCIVGLSPGLDMQLWHLRLEENWVFCFLASTLCRVWLIFCPSSFGHEPWLEEFWENSLYHGTKAMVVLLQSWSVAYQVLTC